MNTEYTFANLGGWRKAYIILSWLLILVYGVAFISMATEPDLGMDSVMGAVIFMTIGVAYVAWLHIAIVGRKLIQLQWICGLTVFPLMNPIAALIVFAISRTTKREIEEGFPAISYEKQEAHDLNEQS